MKINWKEVAQSPGYRSLKAAYMKDLNCGRAKKDLYARFQWVINRAQHYAHVMETTVDQVLNDWENSRDYWWLNYYGESKQPKKHSRALKPIGIRGTRKYYKTRFPNDPKRWAIRVQEILRTLRPKKTKPRWSMKRKARGY